MKKNTLTGLIFSISLMLISCENKEDDKIFSAQKCLNTATAATVDNCVNIVSGVSTTRAYVIRCAGDFIRQDINNSTIVQAIENIDKNDGSNTTDPNVTLYDFFIFDTLTQVAEAVENCRATGSKNLETLAVSAQAATIIKSLTSGLSIQAWLASNPDFSAQDPATLNQLGETILSLQPIACLNNGQFVGSEVCDNLNTAINAGGSSSAIAQAYLNQLKNANSNP